MLLEQIFAASPLDWLAFVTSLIYVVLAARDNNWCWTFAAVATAVWAYQSFVVYRLVSDGLLQVFYFVMAGVGLWRWHWAKRHPAPYAKPARPDILDDELLPQPATHRTIRRMRPIHHLGVIAGSLLGGLFLGHAVSGFMAAAATYPDAITTVASVITTFLLVGRWLENWLYWVVIDLAYVWIYVSTGAALFAVMMGVNVVVAVYGFLNWRREWAAANEPGFSPAG